MNEDAARILASLISRYGTSVAVDPLRCEGLLRDTCPRCRREIFVLVNAVRQQIPADLLSPRHSLPPALFRGFLNKRLQDELAFSDEAASWAVETWAAALGVDTNQNLAKPDTAVTVNLTSAISVPEVITPGTQPEQRAEWAAMLESETIETRLTAIRAMRQSPDTETIRLLITGLENTSWKVREAAFDVLVDAGGHTVPHLIEALGDSHERIVTCATLALGALQAQDGTEALIALLENGRGDISTALWALGKIRDNRAITPLTKFLNSSDPRIRTEAETALKKFR